MKTIYFKTGGMNVDLLRFDKYSLNMRHSSILFHKIIIIKSCLSFVSLLNPQIKLINEISLNFERKIISLIFFMKTFKREYIALKWHNCRMKVQLPQLLPQHVI